MTRSIAAFYKNTTICPCPIVAFLKAAIGDFFFTPSKLMLLVSIMLIDVFKTIINKSFKEIFYIIFMENIKSKLIFFLP